MIQNKQPVRPPNRDRIFDVLDGERDYQDETWPHTEGTGHSVGEFLLLLEEYVSRARAEWTRTHGDDPTMNVMRKVGGIVVRAMEEHGAIPREFHVPASAGITGEMRGRDLGDALALNRPKG